MRDVVFISSPFQLVCFFEYTKHQNLKEYDLFIYFIGERDKEQFLNLCELYSINGYSLIKIRKAIQYLHFCKLADRYHKINKIIIGNFFTDTFLFLVNKIGTSAADVSTEIKINGSNLIGSLKFKRNIPIPMAPYKITI